MTMTYDPRNSRGQEREVFAQIEDATKIGELVGYSVMWFMDGLHARHSILDQEMRQPDVDLGDFVPDEPSPRTALHRALVAMLRDGQNTVIANPDEDSEQADARKLLIRPINDYNKEWMAFGIVGEAANFIETALEYRTQFRVKFHKKTGSMVVVDSPSGAITDEQQNWVLQNRLDPYWQEYKDFHTSRDLSLVVKSVIDWASAISLRKQGGVYFVPVDYEDTLDRVRLLIERLTLIYGGEPVFLCLGVPDEKGTRKQMSIAAHQALVTEADELISEIEKLMASDATTRQRTLKKRIIACHQFGDKLDAYDDILDYRREQMVAQRTKIRELLLELTMMED